MGAGAVTKNLFVVVDGTTYSQDDGLEIEANTDVFEDYEAMEANGFTAKCYRAGLTTWKITVAGNIVYHGTERPTRTETEDSVTVTIPPAQTKVNLIDDAAYSLSVEQPAPFPLTPDNTQEVDVVPPARN